MAKVLILGAGECQLNLINRLKNEGHIVFISDYYENSIGKINNKNNFLMSTFDLRGNLKIAKKIKADCVMTAGTDQPIKTIGYIYEIIGKKGFLSYKQSKQVTNKVYMKQIFIDCQIPTVDYQLIGKNIKSDNIKIKFPAILKPADSQGQRGIYLINSYSELMKFLPDTFKYTRENKVLLETYYPSDEITITGWVEKGSVHVLAITDRETFQEGHHIGICKGHLYPSKYFDEYKNQIIELTEKIVRDFKIKNGPIYFQMLIGNEGIKVNEIAARLGGAYEDEYIPIATGVDFLGLLIDRSLDNWEIKYLNKKHYLNISKYIYIALIFSSNGRVKKITEIKDLIGKNGVYSGKLFIREGQVLPKITNATQRIGYAIITGESKIELENNLEKFWNDLVIEVED